MKNSKRNLANARAKAEQRAEGKPIVSKYERKRLSDEEVASRFLASRKAKGGVEAS